jgi:uncharacterized protein YndB with AHSA1/START domain
VASVRRISPVYTWAFDAEPDPDDDSVAIEAFDEATEPLTKFFSTQSDAEAAATARRDALLAAGIRVVTLINRGHVLYHHDLTSDGPVGPRG